MKTMAPRKDRHPVIKTASLIGGIALAVAGGTAFAEQGGSTSASASGEQIITSTDEMQRLAQQGQQVEEGQLNHEDVVRELGEEQAAEVEQAQEEQQAATEQDRSFEEEQSAQSEDAQEETAIAPGDEAGDAISPPGESSAPQG